MYHLGVSNLLFDPRELRWAAAPVFYLPLRIKMCEVQKLVTKCFKLFCAPFVAFTLVLR